MTRNRIDPRNIKHAQHLERTRRELDAELAEDLREENQRDHEDAEREEQTE